MMMTKMCNGYYWNQKFTRFIILEWTKWGPSYSKPDIFAKEHEQMLRQRDNDKNLTCKRQENYRDDITKEDKGNQQFKTKFVT